MRPVGVAVLGATALISLVCGAQAADLPTQTSAPSSAQSCFASLADYFLAGAQECPLTWNGMTLYRTIDMGAGYQTHGLPFNGVYPNGVEELISKNSNGPRYVLIPNGLGQSNIGVKGNETIFGDWSFLFNLQNGFDPFTLAARQWAKIASSKQRQPARRSKRERRFQPRGATVQNHPTYGTLTAGPQDSLILDGLGSYDAMAAAPSFSVIGVSSSEDRLTYCRFSSIFEAVPTMYMYMLAHPNFDRHDLTTLTRCTVGGQTMPVAKMQEVERRFGCPLIELWGMTEIAGLGTTFPHYGPHTLGSIGMALPHCQARITSVTYAKVTMPAGEVGELMIKGPIVMMGYYGNETATRETIEPDGWLHTGDLASMDEVGQVFVVDRKKDMINTAGFKVFPAEIERVVATHDSVTMVAVGGQPDDLKGEIAKAYVVLRPGATADADSILDLCHKELAAYKVPRAVQFVADLPKTSTGKIMRRELKTLDV